MSCRRAPPPADSYGTVLASKSTFSCCPGDWKPAWGDDVIELSKEDALFFQAHKRHEFKAVGKRACRYMLIIHNRT